MKANPYLRQLSETKVKLMIFFDFFLTYSSCCNNLDYLLDEFI